MYAYRNMSHYICISVFVTVPNIIAAHLIL